MAGGIVGGLLVLGVFAGIAYFLHNKYPYRSYRASDEKVPTTSGAEQVTINPFYAAGEGHLPPPRAGLHPPPPVWSGLPEIQ
jgi:hypothetical protein